MIINILLIFIVMKGSLNAELKVGDKVMCYHMEGEIGVLPGTIGVVTDITTDPFEPNGDEKIISVKWENGSNLALISSTDSWKKVSSEKIDEQRNPDWEFLTQNSDLLNNFDWRWFREYLTTIRDSGIVNMYGASPLLYAGKSHIERYYGENMEDDENFQEVLNNAEESKNKIIDGVIKYMESNQKDVDDMDLVNMYAKTFSKKLLQLYINL
jgi:hypothetical protein